MSPGPRSISCVPTATWGSQGHVGMAPRRRGTSPSVCTSEARPTLRLKEALADRYTLERQLGAGGMATVYLAHDVRHNRKVAIKVMHAELAALIGAERFLKEIETTANFQHPHILPLFDSGQVEGTVFSVRPYVQGESLRSRLTRETQLPVADAIRIAAEIAAGLDYAHRQGVIHRDIQPDNVLFHDGRALVADFGIALAWCGDGRTRMTKAGASLGMPEYMSPEQAAGEQKQDPRTDVYALGVVLYEMLTGRPPFTGPSAQAIFAQVLSEEPRPLVLERKTVPHHIDAAVARALEKLPADRWQTVAQFAEALAGAGQGEQGTGNSRPFVSPDGRWIASARQGKLRKVPVDGGPAIDLAVADWAGGSWGKNGRLVYTRAYNTGLWIVSEGGSDERMLTSPDTAHGELGHWWPQILPDGEHVVFTAYRTPIERATIEVVSIRSGLRSVLFTGGVFGFYVPTGHLLYAVGETIRAVPFDLRRLAVTGPALPVVDSVAMNPTDGAAAFDVSENGTLAYLPVSSYVTETEVVLVNRRGDASRALPGADRYNHPRLSPEGGRIAVDIRSANSLGDVWMFQVGRSGGTRVTAEGGRDFGAEWTPDGRELIYSSERPFFDLYRRAADASRPAEPLLTGTYDRYTGAVSHDGRLFAFVLSVPGGAELWTVPLRGPPVPARYFANGFNLAHPTLSPDGRWMAYDSDESGRVEVYAQSFPDPHLKRWKVSPAQGSEPLWTRGGSELVYRKGDSVMAVGVDLANGRSSQPRALFGGPYPDSPGWTRPRSYDVSRDGERFLMLKLPPERIRPRIHVVLNWFDVLRAKFPR